MRHRILYIDDDVQLATMVKAYLDGFDMEVSLAHTAREGRAAIEEERFDLVLLDVMLPDGDGFEICRSIRSTSSLPVLLLTARGDDSDRIVGLELGADDYLPKPFNPRELLARIRAVLRRSRPVVVEDVLRFGRLQIDRGARMVRVDGERRSLTAHQFSLLVVLAERPGRVLSREQLLKFARGDELEAFDRSIDVHISRIRAVIEEDAKHPQRILTVRGMGYLFVEKQS